MSSSLYLMQCRSRSHGAAKQSRSHPEFSALGGQHPPRPHLERGPLPNGGVRIAALEVRVPHARSLRRGLRNLLFCNACAGNTSPRFRVQVELGQAHAVQVIITTTSTSHFDLSSCITDTCTPTCMHVQSSYSSWCTYDAGAFSLVMFFRKSLMLAIILLLLHGTIRPAGEKQWTQKPWLSPQSRFHGGQPSYPWRYDDAGGYTGEDSRPQKVPRVVPPPAQAAGQPQGS